MLETPHVIVGAAIAYRVANPALAIPLALGSHFILDKIPHWNPHLYSETQKLGKPSQKSTIIAIFDAIVATVLILLILLQFTDNLPMVFNILFSCLASVLPDIVKWPYYFLKVRGGILEKWVLFERKIQVNSSFLPGIITQVVIVVASFLWING